MILRRRKDRLPAIHPGEFLREDFMIPLRLSADTLASALHVPPSRISEIVSERRGISGDTALRLGEYFRTGVEFWMNLQWRYELELARDAAKRSSTKGLRIKPAPLDRKGALLAQTA